MYCTVTANPHTADGCSPLCHSTANAVTGEIIFPERGRLTRHLKIDDDVRRNEQVLKTKLMNISNASLCSDIPSCLYYCTGINVVNFQ